MTDLGLDEQQQDSQKQSTTQSPWSMDDRQRAEVKINRLEKQVELQKKALKEAVVYMLACGDLIDTLKSTGADIIEVLKDFEEKAKVTNPNDIVTQYRLIEPVFSAISDAYGDIIRAVNQIQNGSLSYIALQLQTGAIENATVSEALKIHKGFENLAEFLVRRAKDASTNDQSSS